jgi:ABC-type nitrate/sulfonate/bicarbonate transport system substrate-binding protein
MRTRSFLARWLFGVTILAAGCSSGAGSAGLTSALPGPEQPDITVAAIPAVDLAGLYIAQDRGLFARQGLHVTIVPVPSSQSVITQQLAGYVATRARARAHPGTAAAFTRAIEQGQAIANSDISAVQAILARHDKPAARSHRIDGAALVLSGRPGDRGGHPAGRRRHAQVRRARPA